MRLTARGRVVVALLFVLGVFVLCWASGGSAVPSECP